MAIPANQVLAQLDIEAGILEVPSRRVRWEINPTSWLWRISFERIEGILVLLTKLQQSCLVFDIVSFEYGRNPNIRVLTNLLQIEVGERFHRFISVLLLLELLRLYEYFHEKAFEMLSLRCLITDALRLDRIGIIVAFWYEVAGGQDNWDVLVVIVLPRPP